MNKPDSSRRWLTLLKTKRVLLLLVAGVLVACLVFPWGTKLYQVHMAKSFLEGKVAELDAYKTRHGHYPLNIDDLSPPEVDLPYLVSNHYGFNACSTVRAGRPDRRWYCPIDGGKGFQLSFGYEEGTDKRPSYTFEDSKRVWKCSGAGCLTNHD